MTGRPGRRMSVHILSLLVARVLPLALVCLAFWLFHQSVNALADNGAATPGYIQVVASANRARSFAFLLGVLGILYGFAQRELRRRAAAEFSERLNALRREA